MSRAQDSGLAQAGRDCGPDMVRPSCVIAPSGELVAIGTTFGDELVPCRADLAPCDAYKRSFNFGQYRGQERYRLIVERKGGGRAAVTRMRRHAVTPT